jgi:Mg-chelatase subunit ChlD
LADERRERASRSALGRHPDFAAVSPQLGALDEAAFDERLTVDPDQALALLADLTGAVDEQLAARARALAARTLVGVARRGPVRHGGAVRREPVAADRAPGDLDVDGSIDAIVAAAASGRPPALDELVVSTWARGGLALSFVIDRSGSMHGGQLAAAAVGAAACAWRADDHSVVAFNQRALVLKRQDEVRPPEAVTEDILRLRGSGPTDLALALGVARRQLERSRAPRRVAVLLSDGRPTAGGDPLRAARALDELCVLAPAEDAADAAALARRVGARWAAVSGPSAVPGALRELLDP